MNTTLTDGQLMSTLKLLDQKYVTPERYQTLLQTGILADIFEADIKNCGDHQWLRNKIRISLGLQAIQLVVQVDHSSSFDELVRLNHYHKVRNRLGICRPSHMVREPTKLGIIETAVFDTMDLEDWRSPAEVEERLRIVGRRPATPRELVCFDGAYPFVADHLLVCTYTKMTMLGSDAPIQVIVATNHSPGMERVLSFYPNFFPIRSGGKRILVARTA